MPDSDLDRKLKREVKKDTKENVEEHLEEREHIVQKDETLVDICKKYGISHGEVIVKYPKNRDLFSSEGSPDSGGAPYEIGLRQGETLYIPPLKQKIDCPTRGPEDAPFQFQLRPADCRLYVSDGWAKRLAMDLAHGAYYDVENTNKTPSENAIQSWLEKQLKVNLNDFSALQFKGHEVERITGVGVQMSSTVMSVTSKVVSMIPPGTIPPQVHIPIVVGVAVARVIQKCGGYTLKKLADEFQRHLNKQEIKRHFDGKDLFGMEDPDEEDKSDSPEISKDRFDESRSISLAANAEYILRSAVVHMRKARELLDESVDGKKRIRYIADLPDDHQFVSCTGMVEIVKYAFRYLHEVDKFKNYLLPGISFAIFFIEAFDNYMKAWGYVFPFYEKPIMEFFKRGDHCLCKLDKGFTFMNKERSCILEADDYDKRKARLETYINAKTGRAVYMEGAQDEEERIILQEKSGGDTETPMAIVDAKKIIKMLRQSGNILVNSIWDNKFWAGWGGDADTVTENDEDPIHEDESDEDKLDRIKKQQKRQRFLKFKRDMLHAYDHPGFWIKVEHRFTNWNMKLSKAEKAEAILDEAFTFTEEVVFGTIEPIVQAVKSVTAFSAGQEAILNGSFKGLEIGSGLSVEDTAKAQKKLFKMAYTDAQKPYDIFNKIIGIRNMVPKKTVIKGIRSLVGEDEIPIPDGEDEVDRDPSRKNFLHKSQFLTSDMDRLKNAMKGVLDDKETSYKDTHMGSDKETVDHKAGAIQLEDLFRQVAGHYLAAHKHFIAITLLASKRNNVVALNQTCTEFYKYARLIYGFHYEFDKMERLLVCLITFISDLITHALELTAMESVIKKKIDQLVAPWIMQGFGEHENCMNPGTYCYGPKTSHDLAVKKPVKGDVQTHNVVFIEDFVVDKAEKKATVHLKMHPVIPVVKKKAEVWIAGEDRNGKALFKPVKAYLRASKTVEVELFDWIFRREVVKDSFRIFLDPEKRCMINSAFTYRLPVFKEGTFQSSHTSTNTVYIEDVIAGYKGNVKVFLRMKPPRSLNDEKARVMVHIFKRTDDGTADADLTKDQVEVISSKQCILRSDNSVVFPERDFDGFKEDSYKRGILLEPKSGCKVADKEGQSDTPAVSSVENDRTVYIEEIKYDSRYGAVIEVVLKLDAKLGETGIKWLFTEKAKVKVGFKKRGENGKAEEEWHTELCQPKEIEFHKDTRGKSGTFFVRNSLCVLDFLVPDKDLMVVVEPLWGCKIDADNRKTPSEMSVEKYIMHFVPKAYIHDVLLYKSDYRVEGEGTPNQKLFDEWTILTDVRLTSRQGQKMGVGYKARVKLSLKKGGAVLENPAPKFLSIHQNDTAKFKVEERFRAFENGEPIFDEVVLEADRRCMLDDTGNLCVNCTRDQMTRPKVSIKDTWWDYGRGEFVVSLELDKEVGDKRLKGELWVGIRDTASVEVKLVDEDGDNAIEPVIGIMSKGTDIRIPFIADGIDMAAEVVIGQTSGCIPDESRSKVKFDVRRMPMVCIDELHWNYKKSTVDVDLIMNIPQGKAIDWNIIKMAKAKAKVRVICMNHDNKGMAPQGLLKDVSLHRNKTVSFDFGNEDFVKDAAAVKLIAMGACRVSEDEALSTKQLNVADNIPRAGIDGNPRWNHGKGTIDLKLVVAQPKNQRLGKAFQVELHAVNDGGDSMGGDMVQSTSFHRYITHRFDFTHKDFISKAAAIELRNPKNGLLVEEESGTRFDVDADGNIPRVFIDRADLDYKRRRIKVSMRMDKRLGGSGSSGPRAKLRVGLLDADGTQAADYKDVSIHLNISATLTIPRDNIKEEDYTLFVEPAGHEAKPGCRAHESNAEKTIPASKMKKFIAGKSRRETIR